MVFIKEMTEQVVFDCPMKLILLCFSLRPLFLCSFTIKQSHQLDISVFVQSLRWMKLENVDEDETECILANMIYEGKIKGYISHAHKKLVVSKKDPFPPLTA